MPAIASPDLWLPRQGVGVTQGLQVLITPAGEMMSRSPWWHSDQNNITYTTARNRLIAQERYGNFRSGGTSNVKSAISGKLPIVTGKSGAGPAVIPTTPAVQRQWRKITGEFTYFYLGWFPTLDATYNRPLWTLTNEFIETNGTDFAALDWSTAASFGANRELFIGGTGTQTSFNGVKINWVQVAARDSMTMITYYPSGSANVYQADPYTSITPTVSGSIDWSRTYATFQIPVNDADKKSAEFTSGGCNMYNPSNTSITFTDIGVSVVAFWNRILSPSERAQVWNDPMVLFDTDTSARPVSRRWLDAGGGTDATANPAALSVTVAVVAPAVSATVSSTVSPSPLSMSVAVVAPSVSTSGDPTVTPPPLTVTTAVVAPSVTATVSSTVSPSPLSMSVAVVAPSVSVAGNVTVSPAPLTVTTAVVAPQVTTATNATVSPAALTVTTATTVPTVNVTSTAGITDIAMSVTVVAPQVIIPGSSTVSPSPLTVTTSVVAPAVSTVANPTVAPTPLAITAAVVTPSVTVVSGPTVQPAALPVSVAVVAPQTVVVASYTLTPAALTVTAAVVAPQVTAGAALNIRVDGTATVSAQPGVMRAVFIRADGTAVSDVRLIVTRQIRRTGRRRPRWRF